MKLIRPLYYVKENDIIRWVNYNNLKFINCACKFTEKNNDVNNNSKRKEIKELLKELRKVNPSIDNNIMKSTFNVNLNTIIGYTDKNGNYKSFLDN